MTQNMERAMERGVKICKMETHPLMEINDH